MLRAKLIFTARGGKTNIQDIWETLSDANVPANAKIAFLQELLIGFTVTETQAGFNVAQNTQGAQLPDWIQVDSLAKQPSIQPTLPALENPVAGGSPSRDEMKKIAQKIAEEMLGGIASDKKCCESGRNFFKLVVVIVFLLLLFCTCLLLVLQFQSPFYFRSKSKSFF